MWPDTNNVCNHHANYYNLWIEFVLIILIRFRKKFTSIRGIVSFFVGGKNACAANIDVLFF